VVYCKEGNRSPLFVNGRKKTPWNTNRWNAGRGIKPSKNNGRNSGERETNRVEKGSREHLCNSNSKALAFSLHGKHLSAHLEHRLKALAALDGVLLEALDGEFLNAVLDLLPAAAEGSDLSGLLEDCARGGAGGRGTVNDGFADGEEIVEGHVHAAHGDLFGGRVDVGCLVDLRDIFAAEEGTEPFRCGLFAGDETFGAELV
jgi:hypothetical protein